MGTYAQQLERQRASMSPEQIRRAKCTRCHERRMQRKAMNKSIHVQLNPPTAEQRLAVLDSRLGQHKGAVRERARLKETIRRAA